MRIQEMKEERAWGPAFKTSYQPPHPHLPAEESSASNWPSPQEEEAIKAEENSGEIVSSNILPKAERSRNFLPYLLGLKRNYSFTWFSLSCRALKVGEEVPGRRRGYTQVWSHQ